ncbi:MAG: T9SS type A sorting domain-containing protein [Candidatus Cloacimonetes bacterium]|nr:T9SS type A sorting domain-containing protein [Candidatus Cloacimonadota bacterium]
MNYPNPFNPSTIINYKLPLHIEKTNIKIYNLKGQLVDEITISSQQTTVSWHAEDFSSGIYFYKLNVNGNTEAVKKCLLLK